MPNQAAAPADADAPRPWARAVLHARIPAPLKLLLLALLSALAKADAPRHLLRLPRQDWFIAAHTNPNADQESPQDWHELRRLRRARAELGWLLRGKPRKGMALSGNRAPAPCPARAARAPPWPDRAPDHTQSVAKTPPRAVTTRARNAAKRRYAAGIT